jgi:outer membrane protein assembly factor BamB
MRREGEVGAVPRWWALALATMLAAACHSATRAPDGGAGDGGADAADSGSDADRDATAPFPTEPAPGTCWTVTAVDGTLAIREVDLEARTWREVGRRGEARSQCVQAAGIATSAGSLVFATLRSSFDVDLETGLTREGVDEPELQGLGGRGTELARRWRTGIAIFEDPDGVLEASPSRIVPLPPETPGDRLALAGGSAYLTTSLGPVEPPHLPRSLVVVDLATGDVLRTVELEAVAAQITGMAVVRDRLWLVTTAGVLSALDPETGALLDAFSLRDVPGECAPTGLTCTP